MTEILIGWVGALVAAALIALGTLVRFFHRLRIVTSRLVGR